MAISDSITLTFPLCTNIGKILGVFQLTNPTGDGGTTRSFDETDELFAAVFDALCSRRVCKAAWALEDVLDEIKKGAGSQFDPELVDIFFDILPQLKQAQKRFPESRKDSQ